jgi:transposase
MADATADFASWLAQADIPRSRLTPEVVALLQAVFRFRQQQGTDYFSTRLLGHFLLHAGTGLKLAQIARLLGISRPTASRQQNLSSRQAIQQAHHRLDGRPYGKLLPRYAGAIAGFLLSHPDASRAELIAFVFDTFGVRVSRIALYKFLKKYGLDQIPAAATPDAKVVAIGPPEAPERPPVPAPLSVVVPVPVVSAPPFSSPARSTPAPSC